MATKHSRARLEPARMTEKALWGRVESKLRQLGDPLSTQTGLQIRQAWAEEALACLRVLQERGTQYELFAWEGVSVMPLGAGA